jgi:TPR repeat protein
MVWCLAVAALAVAIGAVVYTTHFDIIPEAIKPAATPAPAAVNAKPGSVEALAPYAKAAAGDAQSQYELGLLLLNGEQGASKNPAQALTWLEMAAKSGHANARYTLGIMYQKGQGALQNFEQALHWFEAAAAQNHPSAQYNAALMYKSGMSVPVDYVKAYTWANVAAVQGHLDAITFRDNLLNAMTPQQVAEGQRASREWKSSDEKPPATPAAAAK